MLPTDANFYKHLPYGSPMVRRKCYNLANSFTTKEDFETFLRYAAECYAHQSWKNPLPDCFSLDDVIITSIEQCGGIYNCSERQVLNWLTDNYRVIDRDVMINKISRIFEEIHENNRQKFYANHPPSKKPVASELDIRDTVYDIGLEHATTKNVRATLKARGYIIDENIFNNTKKIFQQESYNIEKRFKNRKARFGLKSGNSYHFYDKPLTASQSKQEESEVEDTVVYTRTKEAVAAFKTYLDQEIDKYMAEREEPQVEDTVIHKRTKEEAAAFKAYLDQEIDEYMTERQRLNEITESIKRIKETCLKQQLNETNSKLEAAQ